MKLAVPGGVGIFLCQGIVAMSSIPIRAMGHTPLQKGKKFIKGQTGGNLPLGAVLVPSIAPSRALSTPPADRQASLICKDHSPSRIKAPHSALQGKPALNHDSRVSRGP